jgi:hypothetical protein
LLVTSAPYVGGDAGVALMNRKQPVIALQSAEWSLNVIVQPIEGLDVTPLDRFQPVDGSWEAVGLPTSLVTRHRLWGTWASRG